MNIKFMNQPKDVQMGNILKTKLEDNFDEIFITSGIVKDSGIELLIDSFEVAIKNGAKLNLSIGIDRKNTSKDILLKLLTIGTNLKVHVNSEENKVETRIYAFESKTSDSYIYISGGKLSEGGLLENSCMITEIKYDKTEIESFKLFKNQLILGMEGVFKEVDKEDILLLASKGEILTRIIDRKIPSISELYGNKEQVIGEQVYDEGASLGLFKEDELDNVDIEFDFGIDVRKNVELEVEKEAKKDIFEVTNKTEEDLNRLLGNKVEEEAPKKSRIIKDVNDIDFKNMTTLIIEANKVNDGEIRIQKSLSSMMPEFLDVSDTKKISLEIIDNKDNKEYKKENVEMLDNGKGISVKCEKLGELKLAETDLIRLIKMANEKYKIEIIRNDTDEYNVWERYCTNTIKGTKRRYGII